MGKGWGGLFPYSLNPYFMSLKKYKIQQNWQ